MIHYLLILILLFSSTLSAKEPLFPLKKIPSWEQMADFKDLPDENASLSEKISYLKKKGILDESIFKSDTRNWWPDPIIVAIFVEVVIYWLGQYNKYRSKIAPIKSSGKAIINATKQSTDIIVESIYEANKRDLFINRIGIQSQSESETESFVVGGVAVNSCVTSKRNNRYQNLVSELIPVIDDINTVLNQSIGSVDYIDNSERTNNLAENGLISPFSEVYHTSDSELITDSINHLINPKTFNIKKSYIANRQNSDYMNKFYNYSAVVQMLQVVYKHQVFNNMLNENDISNSNTDKLAFYTHISANSIRGVAGKNTDGGFKENAELHANLLRNNVQSLQREKDNNSLYLIWASSITNKMADKL